nr:hypothetical protein [Tanacetum cinerariifolium]
RVHARPAAGVHARPRPGAGGPRAQHAHAARRRAAGRALHLVEFRVEAGEERLGLAGGLTVFEGHEGHLVARVLRAVPGAVLAYEGAVLAAGEDFLARAVGVDFENIGAALLVFGAVLHHVGARAHGDENVLAVLAGQQVAGPVVVVATFGQIQDFLALGRDFGSARLVGV